MGQVSVVLPDPIESPAAAPVAPAEADDLLSQMAGEQIDRMLAEADIQRNPPKAGSGPPGDATTVPTSGGSSTFQGSVPIGADEPSGASANSESSAASPAPSETSDGNSEASSGSQTAQLSDQLDELFATMSADHSAGITEAAEQDLDSASSAAERAALNGSASAAPPTEKPAGGESPAEAPVEKDESAADTDAIDAADAAGAPVPIYLRVLQWLNAPMATCPQRVREAIGKIAILTLVNAMAVIFYVLIFRRH